MRNILKAGVVAATALTLLAAPAVGAREKLTGDEKLAKMLEGRVAGESRSCLSTFSNLNMTIIDGTAVVFRQGGTLWVNVPDNAEDLDRDDIWVTRQFGSQLCRQDTITTHDRSGLYFNGVVFLGDFVPYRTAEG